MKEVVVISGKGGTGKTSITASLAYLGKQKIIVADCDVDAANMHLILKPLNSHSEEFIGGKTVAIDQDKCIQCDKCREVCRFNAINVKDGKYSVEEIDCEGCCYCYHVCPVEAIIPRDYISGRFFTGQTRFDNLLVHARLNIPGDNSGKLVSKIREISKMEAEKINAEYILVDGSPGIGCPVIASITGADYIIIVTEPTISGFHDLQRVSELLASFSASIGCIINKADLSTEFNTLIKTYIEEKNIELLAEIPFNTIFSKAITNGKSIMEFENFKTVKKIEQCWETVKLRLSTIKK